MSSQLEEWYFVEDGKLYRHTENDGYQFMKRGAEPHDEFLMTVEEAKVKCPGRLAEAYGEEKEDFNAIHVVNPTPKDIRKIEKIIDQKVIENEME